MRLNPYAYDRTSRELFEDLSNKKFNCQLEIQKYGRDFKVAEYSKFYMLNPVQFLYSPKSEESKLELATNLGAMVKKYAGSVADLDTCDIEVINGNLAKMSKKITRNVSPAQVKAIETLFQEAIDTLASAKFNQRSWFFAHQRAGFKPNDAVDADQFYKQFSNTGWFGVLGGFNQRVYVKEPKNGDFEIYTTAKPRFYNLFAKEVTVPEKVAAAGNLAKMIDADQSAIVEKRYNVAGMVQNLEAMKASLMRPTNGKEKMTPEQRKMIEKSMNGAIASLKEAEKLIAEEKSKDLTRVVGRFVRDWLILFPFNWTAKPAFNRIVKPLIKTGWNLSINHVVKPVLKTSWNVSINRVLKPVLRASWNVSTFPIKALAAMVK